MMGLIEYISVLDIKGFVTRWKKMEDFFVYYDKDGKCQAIEFNSNADVIFRNISFFGVKYVDVENAFRNIDSDIEIDEVGFNSNKFGIGVYAQIKMIMMQK